MRCRRRSAPISAIVARRKPIGGDTADRRIDQARPPFPAQMDEDAACRTALHFLPGSSRIIRQPLGVVGVVAPWNYPYQLTMGPTVSAIAAGTGS